MGTFRRILRMAIQGFIRTGKRVKLSGYPDQDRLFGYLSERLINIYCIRNRLKVKYIPVIMPLDEAFRNPGNLRYTLRRLKNDLIYKLTKL